MAWSDQDIELFRSVGGVPIETGDDEPTWHFGWFPVDPLLDSRVDAQPWPLFNAAAEPLLGSGSGKTILLYEAARRLWGRDLDCGPQLIGDCVGWGFAGAVDLLACVEVAAGEKEEYPWERRAATEAIYALSRVEFGYLGGSRRDGSSSVWAAEAVREGGTLSRITVGEYDPKRAKEWGRRGLPDELEPEASRHRVAGAALVTRYEEARDAIANGYPVAVGSNRGFRTRRDEDGFAAPKGKWSHCMKFIAAKDDQRPGLLCMNSWGTQSPTGPKGQHDIPDGSFWVDAETCTRMLRQRGGFALSSFSGYSRRVEIISALLADRR
jgi:hypothetical protein